MLCGRWGVMLHGERVWTRYLLEAVMVLRAAQAGPDRLREADYYCSVVMTSAESRTPAAEKSHHLQHNTGAHLTMKSDANWALRDCTRYINSRFK
uniref:Secreted protein n=1 Tax=Heterorhabditis bacteriophora TaxID=37862 RepID=A0A1I7WXA7_HETBA